MKKIAIVVLVCLFAGVGALEYEAPKEEKDLQVWGVKCKDKNGYTREEVYISSERENMQYEVSLCNKVLLSEKYHTNI